MQVTGPLYKEIRIKKKQNLFITPPTVAMINGPCGPSPEIKGKRDIRPFL